MCLGIPKNILTKRRGGMKMEKKIYKSRTVWIGAIAVVVIASQVAMTGNIDPDAIYKVLVASGLVTLRLGGK